ncbi:hypothetical protein ACQJBY_066255 [Aegilops geniculata]
MATEGLRMLLGDASPWSVAGAAAAVALLWLGAWVLEWAWWTPRRLGRALRAQGLRGTRYRLFTGDVPENARLSREARLQPMPRGSHDITPRVQPMSCNVIKEHGMETTSVLLTWTLVVLSMHPEWQEQAREEVLHQFGRTRPDFENLSRLKIVTMILYEVLRLYPPAIFLARRTYKAMELGGIRYPAGVNLMLPLIFIHHDPDIWGKDAKEFNPQRFADGISNAAKHPAAFFPFGGGPRICIGQNVALLEAKMALSTILQRFSFELSPSYIHAPYTVLILQPQHGAQIRLKKI